MKHRHIRLKIILYLLIFICGAIAIEIEILGYTNKKQVHKTTQIVLDQVENILSENERREQATLEALKEDYVDRANTVAYIVEHRVNAKYSCDELRKIATMMSIDEIHLFDNQGVIFSGTNPEYYGLTFDSGEQVSFFKPMLEDKSLTMCQDVMPNTAVQKHMMYAITWDRTGTYMLQVGIEPVRLLEEMKQNSIPEVIEQMPVYDGMNIYIADDATGEVLGATKENTVGKTLYEIGVLEPDEDLNGSDFTAIHLDGFRNFCNYKHYGNYVIAAVHSTESNLPGFLVSLGIEIVWLVLAGAVVAYVMLKLAIANKKINKQMSILSSVSDIYYSMHLIDMSDTANYSIEKLESNGFIDSVTEEDISVQEMLNKIVDSTILDEYKDVVHAFVDLSTIGERLRNKNSIFIDAIDNRVGWLRITFITVKTTDNQLPEKIMIATQVIDEDKKREEELSNKANRDELTGLFNRRAYEDDILNYPDVPTGQDFVYAAIDVNGLKVVNDELGHTAGDELIRGAAICLKRTLGNYGRIYRTGGDEFVSMFFADEEHLQSVAKDLEQETLNWSGKLVENLSISIGYVTKREFETETVIEMAKIADKRMYQAKAQYYEQKGVDRRGQAAAHKALCNLYSKILKINLTEDTFTVVNVDAIEQTKEKGYAEHISEWFKGFGELGQVYPEDLENYFEKTDIDYLKGYFRNDKTSISIQYRRKFDNEFKWVVMDMIPADDYSNDNQSLFLYVKTIDK